MPKGMVEVRDQKVGLALNNSPTISKPFKEILASYCLLVGSDVLANDSTCFLLQFTDQLWLIPEDTYGFFQLKERLSEKTLALPTTIAQIDHLPANWRKKFLFLPGVDPDLKILPTSELEKVSAKLEIITDKPLEDII